MVVVPYQDLDAEILQALLADIVTRDGTDYGIVEVSTDEKVEQLLYQLQSKQAYIVFDATTESCIIMSKEDVDTFEQN